VSLETEDVLYLTGYNSLQTHFSWTLRLAGIGLGASKVEHDVDATERRTNTGGAQH